jgi:hypothetical protein
VVRRALLIAALAACGSFEDPDIVIDFRVLGLTATLPDQVIHLDISSPSPGDFLDEVMPTDVCVLLSDRNFDRRLRWDMLLCDLNSDERCIGPASKLGAGLWDDPDLALTPPQLCVTIPVDGNLLGVVLHALDRDPLRGLGGIYYGVSLRVGGEDADPALDLWAAKGLRLMPAIPPEITANTNPSLDRLDINRKVDEVITEPAELLPFGRCMDQVAPFTVAPDDRVRFTPIETEGAREEYVVPTIDGMKRTFREALTYQWLATAGNYTSGASGGTRDVFGNPAILWTEWISPSAEDLSGPTDVELWVIQRDERLGLTWYQSCVRVIP